ncbi:hypothetical protein V9K98_33775 [Kribbella sp. CCNWLW197]
MRVGQGGDGPGPHTPDGSAVELYELAPVTGEDEVIDAAIEPAAPSSNSAVGPAGSADHCLPSATTWSPSTSRRRCPRCSKDLPSGRKTIAASSSPTSSTCPATDKTWVRAKLT